MGNPEATEEDMNHALRTAVADFVFSLPDGIDTLLTEQGGGLSEGQAQRIAIARALLRRGIFCYWMKRLLRSTRKRNDCY